MLTNNIITMKYLKIIILLVAVGAVIGFGIKTITPKDTSVLKIGAILHLTGDQAEPARAFREGIELAAAEINQKGGINGRKIQLVIEDSKLDPKEAVSAAQKLINVDKVVATLNASFLESSANGPVFNSAKVPVVTLWDSNTSLEEIGPYIFGIGVWTPSSAEKAAQFAYKNLGARKVVVVNMKQEWSEAVTEYFKKEYTAQGGTVVEVLSLAPGSTDFRSTLAKVKQLKPDAIYSPLPDGIVPFYKQANELGIKVPIINSDIITADHIKVDPTVFEGVYQTQPNDPAGPETEKMKSLYKEKHGSDPGQVLFTAWGYDGLNLIAEAIAKGGDAPEKIKDELHKIQGFKGATGTITMNGKGSAPKLENMFQIKKSEFVLVD